MPRNIKNYTIVDRVGILTANFTAAVTGIITSNAHGLKNSDMVILTTTNTLPAGLAITTVYWVIEATTNTFKLSSTSVPPYTTGVQAENYSAVAITDTGTGTHTFTMHNIGNSIDVSDFRHCVISVHGNDAANIDLGFVGSIGKSPTDDSVPDFSTTQAWNNSWTHLDAVNLKTGTAADGAADQVSQTGAITHTLWELNINGIKWINIVMSGWSAGGVTVRCRLFND